MRGGGREHVLLLISHFSIAQFYESANNEGGGGEGGRRGRGYKWSFVVHTVRKFLADFVVWD